ncbi:MAG: D-alanyl-D-alanine carboxypeptidase family protein [Gulosibacter sp.]|uniref:M15 family metallopeptidase n=1 Tax=Gulosibacter sp. TaxID=2817531 RepID=UPI003F91658E
MTAEPDEAAASSSKAPQIARVVGSVALVALTVIGIGIAAGWGAPNEPLSVVSPTTAVVSPTTAPDQPTTSTAPGAPTGDGASTAPTGDATNTPETTAAESTTDLDISTASSVTVLLNKRTPLDPADYAPEPLVYMSDIGIDSINGHALREDAALGIQELFAAAAEAGHVLDMTSGYRDYDLQTQLYDGYVSERGQETADETSARPGYSEHQTGLAADISAPGSDPYCILQECFGETEAGQWLAENSWQYGFILRYEEGETAITGYSYEPWHFRFIGVDAATEYHESGATTYEEFLGVDPAPDYGN